MAHGNRRTLPLHQAIKNGRNRLGLSQAQLGERIGVGQGAIYNWESGKGAPNPSNLKLLEQIIGPIALQEAPNTTEDDGVDGIGNLEDFDPYNKEEIPDLPGVYVFYDISQRPVYVGESQRIATRIDQHRDKFWFRPPILQSASYIEVRDQRLRRQLEQALIKFLKSNAVINKVGTAQR